MSPQGGRASATGATALAAAPLRIASGRLTAVPAGLDRAKAQTMADALESYRDIGFHDLNRDLNLGRVNAGTAARTVAGLDEAMHASPLASEVVTYRGVGSLPKGITGAVGETWTNGAYSSTTADVKTAAGFGRDGGTVLRLRVPAGVGGVQLSEMPRGGRADEREGELLLQRGLVYRVVGRSTVDGVPVIDVEVTPGPVTPVRAAPVRRAPAGLPKLRRR